MPLRPYHGPYAVGTAELEIPVREPRTFGEDFRTLSDGAFAFRLETVLMTVFYPADMDDERKRGRRERHADWLTRPKTGTIAGLMKYAGFSPLLALPVSLPAVGMIFAQLYAHENVPLARSSPSTAQDSPPSEQGVPPATTSESPPSFESARPFPLAIFSHGLGGTRHTYSQFCGELASKGVVVVAVEHRDGSGPSTRIHPPSGGPPRDLQYVRAAELSSDSIPDHAKSDPYAFRRAQLLLRRAELLEAFHVMQRIEAGEGEAVRKASMRNTDGQEDVRWEEWKGRVDTEKVFAAGHSYGGATVIECLRDASTPFLLGLALDPWLDAIDPAVEVGSEPLIKRPLYVINSEQFTVWREHFVRLRRIVAEARRGSGRGWLVTLAGSRHPDFSDFPFVYPLVFRSSVKPDIAMSLFVSSSIKQLVLLLREGISRSYKGNDHGNVDLTEGVKAETQLLNTLEAPLNWEERGQGVGAKEYKKGELGNPGVLTVHQID